MKKQSKPAGTAMTLRSGVAMCLVVIAPCLCGAQQRLGFPVASAYELPRGWGGIIASPGMFGPRVLGESLIGGNRTFSRGETAPLARQPAPLDPLGWGQIGGTERFTRTGRAPGEFVGADGGITPQPGRLMEPGTIPIPNTRPNADYGNAGRARARSARPRVSYRATIAYPSPAAAQVQSQLAKNLQNLVRNAGLPPIEVAVQARTVVLRGAVGTAHNRDLAARLALLEAGVDQVQNELTIAQPRVPAETLTRPAD
jgi:hypothetical protein